MDIPTFCSELQEMLEVEQTITESTNLVALEEYDSLAVMSLIAIIDSKFKTKLSAPQLASITTVASLIDLIGRQRFTGKA